MKWILLRMVLLLPLFLLPLYSSERVVLRFSPDGRDTTAVVREALTKVSARDITLVFESGRYVFRSDFAADQYLAITNHDNGLKRIAFSLDRFDSVRIEGNGAEFIFQGQVLPFLFRGCQEVQVTSLTIDWDVPFYFQATVSEVNRAEQWMDIVPFKEGFSWSVRNGSLLFPDVEGFVYDHLGETLAFNPELKRVAHGAWDMHLASTRVEQRPEGRLRIAAPARTIPKWAR